LQCQRRGQAADASADNDDPFYFHGLTRNVVSFSYQEHAREPNALRTAQRLRQDRIKCGRSA
jgi:hypothetical protein